jgi:hypothetical protein
MSKFRQINQMLGSRPSLGPIPADLIFPWGGISLVVLIFTRSIFPVDWQWTVGLIVWGCVTWAILVGKKPYKFLSKFMNPPCHWSRGHERYQPIRRRK